MLALDDKSLERKSLALADETQDVVAGYMIERALDEMRATVLPGNLDVPPPAPSRPS